MHQNVLCNSNLWFFLEIIQIYWKSIIKWFLPLRVFTAAQQLVLRFFGLFLLLLFSFSLFRLLLFSTLEHLLLVFCNLDGHNFSIFWKLHIFKNINFKKIKYSKTIKFSKKSNLKKSNFQKNSNFQKFKFLKKIKLKKNWKISAARLSLLNVVLLVLLPVLLPNWWGT